MSHRMLVLVTLLVAAAGAACAAPPTAPSPRTLAPADATREMFDPALCRSGWLSSEGRCL